MSDKSGWFLKIYTDKGDVTGFTRIMVPAPISTDDEENIEENSVFTFVFFPGEDEVPLCEWLSDAMNPSWNRKPRHKSHLMAEIQVRNAQGSVTSQYYINYLKVLGYNLHGEGPLVECHLLYRSLTRDSTKITHHMKEDLPWMEVNE